MYINYIYIYVYIYIIHYSWGDQHVDICRSCMCQVEEFSAMLGDLPSHSPEFRVKWWLPLGFMAHTDTGSQLSSVSSGQSCGSSTGCLTSGRSNSRIPNFGKVLAHQPEKLGKTQPTRKTAAFPCCKCCHGWVIGSEITIHRPYVWSYTNKNRFFIQQLWI